MEQYKQEFIEFMVDCKALKFGEFTLKSGRKSPFFMNAGAYVTEQAKVQRLMEELRTVKSTNAKEIARLKKELATLRKIMRNYVIQIDSLNRANEQLKVEKN